MAAEVARAAGLTVDLYEGQGSVGRKFLLAGKGGLNLTHSDDLQQFVARYGKRRDEVARWLAPFDANALRAWARDLGVETFVGTSGRVFPADLKAAPLLRAWVRRLREQGVRFHVHHYCTGIDSMGALQFRTPDGDRQVQADAIVLACGGGSWPQLGSDGRWVAWLGARNIDIAPLQPSNCGFDTDWSDVFAKRFAGQPVKSVVISLADEQGAPSLLQGEFVVTATGIEGSAVYALSANLREKIATNGSAAIHLDLTPDRDLVRLTRELALPRNGRSLTEHLRRKVGIDGVKAGLLYEVLTKAQMDDVAALAAAIKSLPLRLLRPRPLAEAISTAGGISFKALDEFLMLQSLPGVFCAGEMIDWEAPTGGYLLTACFASGRIAGQNVVTWLTRFPRVAPAVLSTEN
ncbi:MAG: TIGR03862 family flavoprotein [Candidatus Obscuribacterales bacterium]|nr:TIGR03862 family flavoprotein [Steroidobacteraceae bacterium]